MYGQAAPHVTPSAPGFDTGLIFSGEWLSFMAICFSSSSGWCSITSDYYCQVCHFITGLTSLPILPQYPASTSKAKVFLLTLFGVTIPTVFATIAGAAIGNAALIVEYPPYAEAYEAHGLGGLLRVVYHPNGWSKFCLVILTFSVIGNNVRPCGSSP